MLNFNFKLLMGSVVIMEQKISINPAKLEQALEMHLKLARLEQKLGLPDARFVSEQQPATAEHDAAVTAFLETQASLLMFKIERAINANTGIRCHVEELPPDVVAGMELEEAELTA